MSTVNFKFDTYFSSKTIYSLQKEPMSETIIRNGSATEPHLSPVTFSFEREVIEESEIYGGKKRVEICAERNASVTAIK